METGKIVTNIVVTLSWIIILFHINTVSVSAVCNNETEFSCTNEECIPLEKVNNSVNDCGDNSEEGYAFDCPKKGSKYQFKCANGDCVPLNYVLDGDPDCTPNQVKHSSDEAKIVGSPCNLGACCDCDIYIPESECNSSDICSCKSGRYSNELGTECIVRKLWDPCDIDSDCYDAIFNTVCEEDMKICVCDVGYYVSEDNTTCVKRKLYDDCEVDEDCNAVMPPTNCTNSQCLCNSGWRPVSDNSTCNKRKIGESCKLQTDCFHAISQAECVEDEDGDSTCQCKFFFRSNTDRTKCTVYRIKNSCENTTQCDYGVSNSNCSNGFCACDSGFKANDNLDSCGLRRIGDDCIVTTDCRDAVSNSSCDNNTCVCDLGFYPSSNHLECLPYKIGDSCSLEDTCDMNEDITDCDSWSSCQDTYDCHTSVSSSHCGVNATCACLPGYAALPSAEYCEAVALGGTCGRYLDCCAINGSFGCDNGSCACSDGYVTENSGYSCRKRQLNESCTEDKDCVLIDHALCSLDNTTGLSLCACSDGYKVNWTLQNCEQRLIGDSCQTLEDCLATIDNSYCSIGALAYADDAALLDPTEDNNAYGICKCQSGLFPNPAQTNCFDFQIGVSNCSQSSDCLQQTDHSFCDAGVCVCDTTFVADENGTSCLLPSIGELTCDSSTFCASIIANSVCEDSFCTCATGFHPSEGDSVTCEVFAIGDSRCRNDLDCSTAVANSVCDEDEVCQCTEGYLLSDDVCTATSITNAPSTSCDTLLCSAPWAIALIILLALIVIAAILLVILGPITGICPFGGFKKPTNKIAPDNAVSAKPGPMKIPIWAQPSVHVMYADKSMTEPEDLELDSDSGCFEGSGEGLVFRNVEALVPTAPPPYSINDPALPNIDQSSS